MLRSPVIMITRGCAGRWARRLAGNSPGAAGLAAGSTPPAGPTPTHGPSLSPPPPQYPAHPPRCALPLHWDSMPGAVRQPPPRGDCDSDGPRPGWSRLAPAARAHSPPAFRQFRPLGPRGPGCGAAAAAAGGGGYSPGQGGGPGPCSDAWDDELEEPGEGCFRATVNCAACSDCCAGHDAGGCCGGGGGGGGGTSARRSPPFPRRCDSDGRGGAPSSWPAAATGRHRDSSGAEPGPPQLRAGRADVPPYDPGPVRRPDWPATAADWPPRAPRHEYSEAGAGAGSESEAEAEARHLHHAGGRAGGHSLASAQSAPAATSPDSDMRPPGHRDRHDGQPIDAAAAPSSRPPASLPRPGPQRLLPPGPPQALRNGAGGRSGGGQAARRSSGGQYPSHLCGGGRYASAGSGSGSSSEGSSSDRRGWPGRAGSEDVRAEDPFHDDWDRW
jgi:hypothetical protein